jgi:hypothetical protein
MAYKKCHYGAHKRMSKISLLAGNDGEKHRNLVLRTARENFYQLMYGGNLWLVNPCWEEFNESNCLGKSEDFH